MPQRQSSSRPPRIAVLCDTFDDEYQSSFVRGLLHHARVANVELLLVFGGQIHAQDPLHAERCFTFDLLGPSNLDGELLVSATIANAVGADGLVRWLGNRPAVPRFSLGVAVPGIPSSLVENRAGVLSLVNHLIEHHEQRRVAFISGPKGSAESQERYEAYRAALAAHSIEVDERLVVQGDFSRAGGERALRALLDERRLQAASIGAIVAANDLMALGALDELARRGIDVPGQVACCGFDDLEAAMYAEPPLTTVRQPVFDQARDGVDAILQQLHGRSPPRVVTLPTELVVRRSCGCRTERRSVRPAAEGPLGRSFESAYMGQRERIRSEVQRAGRGELGVLGKQWDQRLVMALFEAVTGDSADVFTRLCESFVLKLAHAGADLVLLASVLDVLRQESRRCLVSESDRGALLEETLSASMDAITGARLRSEANRRITDGRHCRSLVMASAEALQSQDVSRIGPALQRCLPTFGIESAALALLDGEPDPDSTARPVFAFSTRGSVLLRETIKAGELAPPGYFDVARGHHVLLSIPYARGGRAFAVLSGPSMNMGIMESVRDVLIGILSGFASVLGTRQSGR